MAEILLGTFTFTTIVVVLALFVIVAKRLLTPSGSVSITLNAGRQVLQAPIGVKLLDALTDAGIYLPSACGGAGTCGLCRVLAPKDQVEASPQDLGVLSVKDVADGARLACQVRVRSALNITLPEEVFGVHDWTCTVTRTCNVASLIREIELSLPAGFEDERLRAGSFVQITAPAFEARFADFAIEDAYRDVWQKAGLFDLVARAEKPVTRAYSIANAPNEMGRILLNVRIALPPPGQDVPPGQVSSWLFSLTVGDPVQVRGPFGHFIVEETSREAVFIAGGAGMAPMRAHLLDLLEVQGSKRRISYWYGGRSKRELFYTDLFDGLAAKHDNFTWTVALSEPEPDDHWDGPTGYIHDAVYQRYLKDHPMAAACEYYLCGPPMMIKAVRALLDKLGVPRDNVHYDDFGG